MRWGPHVHASRDTDLCSKRGPVFVRGWCPRNMEQRSCNAARGHILQMLQAREMLQWFVIWPCASRSACSSEALRIPIGVARRWRLIVQLELKVAEGCLYLEILWHVPPSTNYCSKRPAKPLSTLSKLDAHAVELTLLTLCPEIIPRKLLLSIRDALRYLKFPNPDSDC